MPFKNKEKQKAYQEKYRKAHPEKYYYVGRSQKRKEENPEQWMYWRTKHSAKKRNLEFNIDKEDIKIPEYCPILGIKLELGSENGIGNSPSLDRIDNNKGYVKGNIAVISNRANSLKSNMTKEIIEKLYKYVSNA